MLLWMFNLTPEQIGRFDPDYLEELLASVEAKAENKRFEERKKSSADISFYD